MATGERIAVLAPMSGLSERGFRRAAEATGADYAVTEMVDGAFLARRDAANMVKAAGTGIGCHVVQIAGCTGAVLAEAARIAADSGADAIDINMGCPAKKVVGGLAGSALMRDLDGAVRLVAAVKAAVAVPVSVKMRLGWDDDSINAPLLARRAEAEGVALVSVHGRTRCQFYKGRADWRAIRAVVDAVAIPVLANGDCASPEDALDMLAQSGAAGVMVGRAAIGRPWLVGDIAHALRTGERRAPLSDKARRDLAREHYETLIATMGAEHGVRHARKHLAGYAASAGFDAGHERHRALVTAQTPGRVLELLDDLFGPVPLPMPAAASSAPERKAA